MSFARPILESASRLGNRALFPLTRARARLAPQVQQMQQVSTDTLRDGTALSGTVNYDRNTDTGVATLKINRPRAFNALNREIVHDLVSILNEVSYDDSIRAVVLTGSDQVFAAGADVQEMLAMDYSTMRDHDRDTSLLEIGNLKCIKPVVAAVNGVAFGGGCELAMICDIIIAGENAKFGQPEINLGIIAGAGGTQRLTKAVGKSLSMQMNLTGEPIGPERALQAGLVSEVVPTEKTVDRATEIAEIIASKSRPAVRKIHKLVNQSFETSLEAGCDAEKEAFVACWATHDQHEGMTAFAEKRKPEWKHN